MGEQALLRYGYEICIAVLSPLLPRADVTLYLCILLFETGGGGAWRHCWLYCRDKSSRAHLYLFATGNDTLSGVSATPVAPYLFRRWRVAYFLKVGDSADASPRTRRLVVDAPFCCLAHDRRAFHTARLQWYDLRCGRTCPLTLAWRETPYCSDYLIVVFCV